MTPDVAIPAVNVKAVAVAVDTKGVGKDNITF
jgi:hypothetical protein